MNTATPTASNNLADMPFLNRLLGGGLPTGQLIGLVGPTGEGKTFLAMQIAHALASNERGVLYVSLDLGDGIHKRLLDLVFTEERDQFDEREEERRQKAYKATTEHLSLVQPERIENPDQLLGMIYDMEDRTGSVPSLIIIDQLALWIMKNKEQVNAQNITHYCQKLKTFSRQTGITILLLHQLKSALGSKPPIRIPTDDDAADSNSFGSLMDIALFLGTRGTQRCQRISRPATNQHELVWMDAPNQRYRSLSTMGEYIKPHPPSKDFIVTAEARRQGLFSPFDVDQLLWGKRGVTPFVESLELVEFQSTDAPAPTEPTASLSCYDAVHFLIAASWIAPGLELEHGRLMIALLCSDSSCMSLFALWCRMHGRRDFLDLLRPDPLNEAETLRTLYAETDLSAFQNWVIDQATQYGWTGVPAASPFKKIAKAADKTGTLLSVYKKEHGQYLRGVWNEHRAIFAELIQTRNPSGSFEVESGGYGDKNDKPNAWIALQDLFVTTAVSPVDFLEEYSSLYNAVPWPASFPTLLSSYTGTRETNHLPPDQCDEILKELLGADLSPWQLALIALTVIPDLDPTATFVPECYWVELGWKMLGDATLTEKASLLLQ